MRTSGKPVFELMEQTVETCGNDDVLLATMLKCLLAFVYVFSRDGT